jgi:RNA polymerase sigma-70 factor, ECF subfamily
MNERKARGGALGREAGADLSAAVTRAQAGDEDAFRQLYRAVHPGMLRYLRGLVGADAEDVASEAWSQIARDLGAFQGDGDGFRGWAATIARNRALDHLRWQRRRPASSISAEELVGVASPDDTAARAIELVTVHNAIALIAQLPRDQAEAVLLRVVMGLDVATTGQVLGKRSGAVRTATHRGLRRLAELLGSGTQAQSQPPQPRRVPRTPPEPRPRPVPQRPRPDEPDHATTATDAP